MNQEMDLNHTVIRKKISKEDEYFIKKDKEFIKEAKLKKEKEEIKKQKEAQKVLHYMKCPKCGFDLKEIEFKDILIDICPECKGIWLDKEELKELLNRETGVVKSLLKGFSKDADFKKIE